MKIKVEGFEVIQDKNGVYAKPTEDTIDIPDDQVRDEEICMICGWPDYPNCKKTCHNFRTD